MNILLIKHFFVGFIVSEIPRVSVFGYCPYSVTFPYYLPDVTIYPSMKCSTDIELSSTRFISLSEFKSPLHTFLSVI